MNDDMKTYLSALQIPVEQKRYAMNFCKKIRYLNELHEMAVKEINGYIRVGYGNVNSKICSYYITLQFSCQGVFEYFFNFFIIFFAI